MHGVLVSCTEQNTKIRVPVQPGVYGIQHGAECVHDVVQTANYSAMRLHYSAGKLHGWFTYDIMLRRDYICIIEYYLRVSCLPMQR